MKIDTKGDKVRRVLEGDKGAWFDLSYRVRMNKDDTFDYENVTIVKSSNKSEDGKC